MAARLRFLKAVALVLAPAALAVALYSPSDFSPAPMPPEYSYGADVSAPRHEPRALARSEHVGEGRLPAPEDLAYDGAGGWLYTGCADGWVRRVSVPGGDVPDRWPPARCRHRGGWRSRRRRCGHRAAQGERRQEGRAAYGRGGGPQVRADRRRGRRRRWHHLLHDASNKYSLHDHMTDILEARPYGRLLSFDPSTGRTAVLARDLYFANGVAVSPDQTSLIYCETVLRRRSRYHLTGDKKGTVQKFIDNLPGFPDNIRYDGEGRYWIALSSGRTLQWDLLTKHPFLRKLVYLVGKFVAVPTGLKNSGAVSVALDGEPVSMYSDPGLALATGWLKVGDYLYYGSLTEAYLSRIDLTESSAESDK